MLAIIQIKWKETFLKEEIFEFLVRKFVEVFTTILRQMRAIQITKTHGVHGKCMKFSPRHGMNLQAHMKT